ARNSYAIQSLITKLKNPDADLRFMALNDLNAEARQPGFSLDDPTEHQLVDQVLALVTDVNGEVKSVAVKTLATLIPHVGTTRIQTIIDRLVQFTASKEDEGGVRDIASLGLKMVVAEVQPGTPLAQTCCSKLAPEIVKQLNDAASSAELVVDSLDLVSDILSRFESTVRSNTHLQQSILKATTPLLSHGRPAVRKRAVAALATLIPTTTTASSNVFDTLVSTTILPTLQASTSTRGDDQFRTSVSLVAALARSAPTRIGPRVAELVPLVLVGATKDDDEAKEGVLQCLEALVLTCPTETGPLLNRIVDKGTELLKYDPNFAGGDDGDDEDEEMADDEEQDDDELDDDEFEEEYDDDDDTSFKVRRSATKLLTACIQTRPDLLAHFYKTVSPALIARFGEREPTVRVEVWATYTAMLKQTKALVKPSASANNGYSSGGGAGGASPRGSLKRKRSDSQMDTEDSSSPATTPLAQLTAQTPAIVKSIVKQLHLTKALQDRQAAFALLYELVSVLEVGSGSGGLESSQVPQLVQRVEVALKTSDAGLSGAATSLKIQVLAFLALFFKTHPVKTFADEPLERLVPLVAASINDRFNKIAAEAFVTASELVRVLRPVTPAPPSVLPPAHAQHLTTLYQATMNKLNGSDADEDVKGRGMQTLGTLLYHAGDHAASASSSTDLDAALSFLRDRLRNEVQRVTAVTVVGHVAASPVLQPGTSTAVDQWATECLAEVSSLLRKVHRPLKIAAFEAIDAVLARNQGAEGVSLLPVETTQALVNDLAPLLVAADPSSSSSTTHLVGTASSSSAGSSSQQQQASAQPVGISASTAAAAVANAPVPALEGMTRFFRALIKAGANPSEVLEQLSAAGVKEAVAVVAVVAKCVGAVVVEAESEADAVVKSGAKSATASPSDLVLALLTLGEVGRVVDLSGHKGLYEKIVEHFSSPSEDVRRSAAFAAGNIAVGNPSAFLPSILALIQSDDKKRYLALQSLKEVIIHSPTESLAAISDQLWTPLFENCEAQEEGTRNVAADCLGQLTVINPAKFLPQLQARLASDSRDTRATVIAALRFTFTNDSTTYDEVLAPLIVEFFKLMRDSDLGVRRLALSSLNSAAHNKPYLVRSHLDSLLPELYAQTEVDQSLIRIVEMGPFKHKVDDGLDIRKTAYECMHSLLDTCAKQIDLQEYLSRVIAGLADEEEVKKLCYIMLVKLAQVAPAVVAARLDETVPSFTETLGIVLKDNAVKQEAERTLELQKSAVRCLAVLNHLASPS
ncbi:TIP120-domain-containing protein, partial [Rhodotorula sp. JG-1b]